MVINGPNAVALGATVQFRAVVFDYDNSVITLSGATATGTLEGGRVLRFT